jgi:hypothetical protein
MSLFDWADVAFGRTADPDQMNLLGAAVERHDAQLQGVDMAYYTGGTIINVSPAGTEAAMSAWGGSNPDFLIETGWIYECNCVVNVADTGTSGTAAQMTWRLRKGINTTSGQQLGQRYLATKGGDHVCSHTAIVYIKNVTGTNITTKLGFTIAGNSGGPNFKLYGDTSVPLSVAIKKLALVANAPNVAGVATAIV